MKGRNPSKLLWKKVSKITALQNQYPNAGISNYTKANRHAMDRKIQDLARSRIENGCGEVKLFLNGQQEALFFEDGFITWIFDLDRTFHSLRIN